jgi:hypothetical protein
VRKLQQRKKLGRRGSEVGPTSAKLSLVHSLFHTNTADTKDTLFPSDAYWQMRKTASRPRSWANFSLLSLCSHRNAWANLHLLGQPNTFFAAGKKSKGGLGADARARWCTGCAKAHPGAGLDEGILPFSLPILVYIENPYSSQQIIVTNDGAPSSIRRR